MVKIQAPYNEPVFFNFYFLSANLLTAASS